MSHRDRWLLTIVLSFLGLTSAIVVGGLVYDHFNHGVTVGIAMVLFVAAVLSDLSRRTAKRPAGEPTLITTGSTEDPIHEYVIRLLEANGVYHDAHAAKVAELEAAGRRLIDVTEDPDEQWKITDWRTGALIAEGGGTNDEYDAIVQQLDPDGLWLHIDGVEPEEVEVEIPDGLPPGLAIAVQEWVSTPGVPTEEVAGYIGWPVEKVAALRD